ncbi:MAG TPA: (d)CMP kinase [Mesotoga sp.]|nr:(d)CMP kinase [Mesotoga sp.]
MRIAIDGPAGSGKSTVAKLVARDLNFVYIDTGAMYRALALKAHSLKIEFSDESPMVELMNHTYFSLSENGITLDGRFLGEEIRTREVSMLSSNIARYPYVRAYLTEQQRSLSRQGNVVMEGRDIGTIVLPDAELKIFLTASIEERARRRYAELIASLKEVDYESVLREMKARDLNDSSRELAPLKPAKDAIRLDTTGLSISEVVEKVAAMARKRQRVLLSKSVGFCYGVDRAVNEAIKILKSGKSVFATGEIVHNEAVMKNLKDLGLEIIEDISSYDRVDGIAIIRAHGIDPGSEKRLREVFTGVIDLTCPIVYNVFSLAVDLQARGSFVVVFGKRNHPEVTALSGRLERYLIVEPGEDYSSVVDRLKAIERIAVVSQTTMSTDDFKDFSSFLEEELGDRVEIHNTICRITVERESEARRLACEADTVIVVGGKNSFNTKKLLDIVGRLGKRAIHVQTTGDLPQGELGRTGLISGTSTPYDQIQKILDYIDNEREVTDNGRETGTAR